MKTNHVPATVMLFAGAMYCLFGIVNKVKLMDFLTQLLLILIVFWVLGGIIKIVLDKFMGEVVVKREKEDETKEAEEGKSEGGKSEGDKSKEENAEDGKVTQKLVTPSEGE